MVSRFLPVKENDTVLNYYALPLIGYNKKYFRERLITTKVNKEGTTVYVEVIPNYLYDENFSAVQIENDGHHYLVFSVPNIFITDMLKIIKGKYSELSEIAKNAIVKKSGLIFQHKLKNGEVQTSKLLFALDKSELLKDFYYEKLKSNNEKHNKQLYEALNNVELMEKISKKDLL